jgi:hypothetical protein
MGADQLGACLGTTGTKVAQQALVVRLRHAFSADCSRAFATAFSLLDEPDRGGVGANEANAWEGEPRRVRHRRPLAELNLNDSGPGSLRQALLDTNAAPGIGTELINFTVAGTIRLTSGALAPVTHRVNVDGTSAPGFSLRQAPVVEVDDNGFGGLQFNTGSAGSALRSLAIVNARSDGITLNDGNILVVGNFIGLGLDGSTVVGNGGNAILRNSIYNNQNAGIVLQPGANGSQAAPRLTHIMRCRQRTVIGGKLFSTPNSIYHVEFFANNSVLPSRASGGQTYLGSTTVTTDRRGIAPIRFVVPTQSTTAFFTATATSAANNTSAFSNGVPRSSSRVRISSSRRGRD